jgi:hypothetical protein
MCTSLALDEELAFLSLVLKNKKWLELAYESSIVGALRHSNFSPLILLATETSRKQKKWTHVLSPFFPNGLHANVLGAQCRR